jgi:ferredoxin
MFTILYFSPTGNGQYAAELLAQELGQEAAGPMALENTAPKDLQANDHLVLIYPIHGFTPPRTVKRFVRSLPSGLYEKVSLLSVGCTTAWINQGASWSLRSALQSKGYPLHLDEVLEMPLTFVTEFPEDRTRELLAAVQAKAKDLCRRLKEKSLELRKVGFLPKVISFLGQGESLAARFFGLELHASKDCTSCGTCWNNCPENNIQPNGKGKPVFGFNCLMCMRCIYQCPEKAITPYLSKFLPIKNGYHLRDKLDQIEEGKTQDSKA